LRKTQVEHIIEVQQKNTTTMRIRLDRGNRGENDKYKRKKEKSTSVTGFVKMAIPMNIPAINV